MVLFFFSISLFIPGTTKAVDLRETFTSEDSIVVKIQEGLQYFFAFSLDKKVEVLEKQAERRLIRAKDYAEEGNNEKVQNLLQNYLQIKERQNNLLGKTDDGDVLGMVEERTIEQQKTMEEIKNKIDDNGKQGVIDVQEAVVNQVAERIIVVNGTEGQTEFFNKVEHVWAPGTGPGGEAGTTFAPGTSGTGSGGGEAGVVVEGGTIQFAPGTSGGGSAVNDIQNVVIEGGGGSAGGTTVVGGGTNVVEGGGGE